MGNTACVPCPPGTFKETAGITPCSSCESVRPGFTTPGRGTIDPADCRVREYLCVCVCV